MTEVREGILKEWRQMLFEAKMQYGSEYSMKRVDIVLHQINNVINDGEDVDHISPRNEK